MIARNSLESALIILIGLAIATLCASQILQSALIANVVLLALAAMKGRRILLDFLGLRNAPAIWRVLVTAWVLGVGSFAWAASVVRLMI
jgi:hypothetical protein